MSEERKIRRLVVQIPANDWLDGEIKAELSLAERAVFVSFLCLARVNSPDGQFSAKSIRHLAQRLGASVKTVRSTTKNALFHDRIRLEITKKPRKDSQKTEVINVPYNEFGTYLKLLESSRSQDEFTSFTIYIVSWGSWQGKHQSSNSSKKNALADKSPQSTPEERPWNIATPEAKSAAEKDKDNEKDNEDDKEKEKDISSRLPLSPGSKKRPKGREEIMAEDGLKVIKGCITDQLHTDEVPEAKDLGGLGGLVLFIDEEPFITFDAKYMDAYKNAEHPREIEGGDYVEAKYRETLRFGRGHNEIVDIRVIAKGVDGDNDQPLFGEAENSEATDSTTREILAILEDFPGYPFDEAEDLEFVELLIENYSPKMGEKALINDIKNWTRKATLLKTCPIRDQLGNWLDNKVRLLEKDGKLKAD